MQVILLDKNEKLEPLTFRLPKVVLSICGKSLVEFWLDMLCDSKLTEINIVGANNDKIIDVIGSGSRWGMAITYSGTLEEKLTQDTLIINVDHLCDINSMDLFGIDENTSFFVQNNKIAVFLKADTICIDPFDMDLSVTEIAGEHISIQSLKDFHKLNLDVLLGKYDHLVPAGRRISERLYLNKMSKYSSRNLCSGSLYLGARCKIDKSVSIQNNVIIGRNAIISREAKISNSIILPNTHIGKFTELNHSIVWGKYLIRLDYDVVVEIEDQFILGDIKSKGPTLGSHLKSLFS